MENKDNYYMGLALKEANKAKLLDEVPVGCIIVLNDTVIARSHNTRNKSKSVFGHAEINTIKKACKKMNCWMLDDAIMYVTLEPCLMCAGAILQSRIKRVVFAANEPKFGVFGSVLNVFETNPFCHHIEVTKGIMEQESSTMLKEFFKEKRKVKKDTKIE